MSYATNKRVVQLDKALDLTLASSAIRRIDDFNLRVVIAAKTVNCSLRRAIIHTKSSPSSVYRAKKAYLEHREIGVNGRPTRLSRQKEAELVELVQKRTKEGKAMRYGEVKEAVRPSKLFPEPTYGFLT